MTLEEALKRHHIAMVVLQEVACAYEVDYNTLVNRTTDKRLPSKNFIDESVKSINEANIVIRFYTELDSILNQSL